MSLWYISFLHLLFSFLHCLYLLLTHTPSGTLLNPMNGALKEWEHVLFKRHVGSFSFSLQLLTSSWHQGCSYRRKKKLIRIFWWQRFLKRKAVHKFKRVKEGNPHYSFTCITVTIASLKLQKFSSLCTVKSAIILNIVRWRGRFLFLLPVPCVWDSRIEQL